MRMVLFLAACLMAGNGLTEESPEDRLIDQVYKNGGTLLYCNTEFNPGDRVRVDRIYPQRQMLHEFNCRSARLCSDPRFEAAHGDLHNLFAISRRTDMDRRGTLFRELPESVTRTDCGYQVSFQAFYPAEGTRGKVARAMLYMHVRHELPLVGVMEMYQRWSNDEPPDDHERQRNDAIERVQGNRNPYIDNPDEVNNIVFDLF